MICDNLSDFSLQHVTHHVRLVMDLELQNVQVVRLNSIKLEIMSAKVSKIKISSWLQFTEYFIITFPCPTKNSTAGL